MMTQKEALAFLHQELEVLEAQDLGPPEWRAQWREAIAALEAEPLAEWRALIHIALDGSGFAFFDEPPKPVGMGRDRHCRVAIYADA